MGDDQGRRGTQYNLCRVFAGGFLAGLPHPVTGVCWPAFGVNEHRQDISKLLPHSVWYSGFHHFLVADSGGGFVGADVSRNSSLTRDDLCHALKLLSLFSLA